MAASINTDYSNLKRKADDSFEFYEHKKFSKRRRMSPTMEQQAVSPSPCEENRISAETSQKTYKYCALDGTVGTIVASKIDGKLEILSRLQLDDDVKDPSDLFVPRTAAENRISAVTEQVNKATRQQANKPTPCPVVQNNSSLRDILNVFRSTLQSVDKFYE